MSSPSPFYQQHHQVEPPRIDATTFRPGWRRRTRLDSLFDARLITGPEHRCATRFRALYERAQQGAVRVSPWRLYVDAGCRRLRTEPGDAMLDAGAWSARVERSLGGLYPLVVWLVVEDCVWCEIGRRLDIDRRTAKTWCAAAVAGLAAL
jgi:hypothetical protein